MKIVFTKHAQEQMERRSIQLEDVTGALRYPLRARKMHGLYLFLYKTDRGQIEVCTERAVTHIKIVTVYWK